MDETFEVYIQSSAGSTLRLQMDEHNLNIKGTHTLPAAHPWPYGFILKTQAEDGDCLDCFVLTYQPLQAKQTVLCQAIGMLEMWENDQPDHKILAVLPGESINLNAYERDVLVLFLESIFSTNRDIQIKIGKILPASAAYELLSDN